jgi:L-alanine-DL-glutamate epimerase-like enolase superfamily enzyme
MAEGFTLLKFDIGFHAHHLWNVPGGVWELNDTYPYHGHATEKGINAQLAIVEALKGVLGDEVGLALDCGPGQTLQAAMTLAKELEPYRVAWAEDFLTGADIPYDSYESYRLLSQSTTTPILAGENTYLRQGFRGFIERNAVDVIAPDIHDVGGLAEAKWVAEYADLYDMLVAPHNANMTICFMANLHVGAVMPRNYIAFEFHNAGESWWEDMITGVEKPLIRDGFGIVPDGPGLGFDLNPAVIEHMLAPGEHFFD